MEYVIDRIEGKYAICVGDDRSNFTLPLSCFPKTVREGVCFEQSTGGKITILESKTEEKEKRNRKRMDDLFE